MSPIMILSALCLSVFMSESSQAASADCGSCQKLSAEIASLSASEKEAQSELEKHQATLRTLHPEDVKTKVKLSSQLLLLTSRVETLANGHATKQQLFERMGCQKLACPTAKPRIK